MLFPVELCEKPHDLFNLIPTTGRTIVSVEQDRKGEALATIAAAHGPTETYGIELSDLRAAEAETVQDREKLNRVFDSLEEDPGLDTRQHALLTELRRLVPKPPALVSSGKAAVRKGGAKPAARNKTGARTRTAATQ